MAPASDQPRPCAHRCMPATQSAQKAGCSSSTALGRHQHPEQPSSKRLPEASQPWVHPPTMTVLPLQNPCRIHVCAGHGINGRGGWAPPAACPRPRQEPEPARGLLHQALVRQPWGAGGAEAGGHLCVSLRRGNFWGGVGACQAVQQSQGLSRQPAEQCRAGLRHHACQHCIHIDSRASGTPTCQHCRGSDGSRPRQGLRQPASIACTSLPLTGFRQLAAPHWL